MPGELQGIFKLPPKVIQLPLEKIHFIFLVFDMQLFIFIGGDVH